MNNSLERLFDGMIDTLRRSVIPHIGDEFARGQTYGVIFMLKSIARRADWSDAFLREQIAALEGLAAELGAMPNLPPAAAEVAKFARRGGAMTALESRDLGDAQVCALIDSLADDAVAPEQLAALQVALDGYIHRQLKHEIATSAKPMFAEISSGAED